MNYSSEEFGEIFKPKYFKKNQVSFATDSCNVSMGENFFIGNLNANDGFVRGTVVSEQSEPMAGANIIIENTTEV